MTQNKGRQTTTWLLALPIALALALLAVLPAGRWLEYPAGQQGGSNSLEDPKAVAALCAALAVK